jgi:hypothetical protein
MEVLRFVELTHRAPLDELPDKLVGVGVVERGAETMKSFLGALVPSAMRRR